MFVWNVAKLYDGLPTVFIVSGSISQFLQAPEDYSRNFLVTSIFNIIRFLLLIITLFLPGFYISVSTFHLEMIPTELTLIIIESEEGVPFPTFIEVLSY